MAFKTFGLSPESIAETLSEENLKMHLNAFAQMPELLAMLRIGLQTVFESHGDRLALAIPGLFASVEECMREAERQAKQMFENSDLWDERMRYEALGALGKESFKMIALSLTLRAIIDVHLWMYALEAKLPPEKMPKRFDTETGEWK